MTTKLLTKREHERLKKKMGYRGAISEAATFTGLHRTTVSRIIETGRGNADAVAKLIEFYITLNK